MRTGWLIWEDSLSEFIYFEERMRAPAAEDYVAEWNVTPAKGIRKSSKSLWVFDRRTKQKRFSVTTSAGIKIQPYFDVPPPSDRNLYYFRVQGEQVDSQRIRLWASASTAAALRDRLGSLECEVITNAFLAALDNAVPESRAAGQKENLAVGIVMMTTAYQRVVREWDAVSDEHRAQLLLRALTEPGR
jgi:hypothetical protein